MNDRLLLSAWPCGGCGSPVALIGATCVNPACGAYNPGPQPGQQEAFLGCPASICVYGGGTGGGKSWSLLLDWMRYIDTPGANGLIVRNRDTDITVGGGLWDQAVGLYSDTGAHFRSGSGNRDITWPSGAKLSFRHLDDRNAKRFKGPGFSWIGIDEANECSIEAIMYLQSRNRSTCGARAVMRMSCNPDPDHVLAEWVDWYLDEHGAADRSKSGIVRWMQRSLETGRFVFADSAEAVAELSGGDPAHAMTFSFIPSLLDDNPALDLTDPGYRSKIANMDSVDQAQLGGGNWRVRAEFGGMFRRVWWGEASEPLSPIVRRIRSWDRAGSAPSKDYPDPDFTVGVLVAWDVHGRWYVVDVVACRAEPPEIDQLMEATAERDGAGVMQVVQIDPAQAGKVENRHTRTVLGRSGVCGPIVSIRPVEDKVTRGKPVSDNLRMGMTGKAGERVPRGFVLVGAWMAMPYRDGGPAPRTMGELFWQQIVQFYNPKKDKKKDIPDALIAAHEANEANPLGRRDGGVLERARRLS